MTEGIPDHHRRYAAAWSLHQDRSCSDESRILLEHEMDDAQNHFEWDEFQQFKATLPGFAEHWDGKLEELADVLREKFQV